MDKEYFNFIKDAYENGLCDEYRDEIKRCHEDRLKLVTLAMRQQSIPFVATKLHAGVVTKDYVKKAFDGLLNGFILKDCDGVKGYTYSWFVDYPYDNDIMVDMDVAHISFTKDKNVVIAQTKCPTIYVSNKSDVHIVCEGYNTVKVYLFDESVITLDDVDEESSVLVYRYGKRSKVESGKFCLSDKIRVFNKELKI